MRPLALTLGIALALAGGSDGSVAPDPLAVYRGNSRILVVAAPDVRDPGLLAQREALVPARAGLRERDLVVVEAVGTGAEASALRRRLGLPERAFRAVLIGKDGGLKLTATEPVAPERLFATIDVMPMRRDEMRGSR
ncbi:DUF4174 domain-containing protein [Methylobacterium radiodurans]|uniref:DUF4174 domain-containing protein n=1 Tax=Methylobacterium radiodurans TaxID=2202828 RepID=A0A2U8VYG4_9HYPH|nr:DUF4174 domain-containing protein [Methylobacterium radiodurans]AWN38498.1 hypothetical protein DK427_24485 [Methylobacterium radiodurans]